MGCDLPMKCTLLYCSLFLTMDVRSCFNFPTMTWNSEPTQFSQQQKKETKIRNCLRLFLYCYDKTLTKDNSGRKGFISASSYGLSWREARTGTLVSNTEAGSEQRPRRRMLPSGLISMACSACFSYNPGPHAQGSTTHSRLCPATSNINQILLDSESWFCA